MKEILDNWEHGGLSCKKKLPISSKHTFDDLVYPEKALDPTHHPIKL